MSTAVRYGSTVGDVEGRLDDARQNVIARGQADGSLLVYTADEKWYAGEITSYPKRNVKAATAVRRIPPVSEDAMDCVTDFDYSPDGKTLAVASQAEFGKARLDLYDVVGVELRHRTRMDVPARLVSFGPDGLTLAMLGHDEDDDGNYCPDKYLTLIDLE